MRDVRILNAIKWRDVFPESTESNGFCRAWRGKTAAFISWCINFPPKIPSNKLPTSYMASTLGSYVVWMEVLSSQENRLDAWARYILSQLVSLNSSYNVIWSSRINLSSLQKGVLKEVVPPSMQSGMHAAMQHVWRPSISYHTWQLLWNHTGIS